MIAASSLSPDEYAMRIATQTVSALICKEYSSPFIVSPISVFPAPQRESLLQWAGVKEYTVQGVVPTDHHRCSLLATVTRDIGRPVACVVCLRFLPLCRLFLLACKTMYRSSAGVVPRGRPQLNPGYRFLWFEIVSKVVKRCCEQFRTLQPHLSHCGLPPTSQ
ncbi:uncharacterized protein TNCV_2375961 [Trichonephila clavipes]|nr:uncharacterized protein TNCV_2375961 [Trichonephila clavipes]